MIFVYYTKFSEKLPSEIEREYLKLLPFPFLKKNKSYRFWEDRHRHLLGVLLLLEGAQYFDRNIEVLEEIKYNEYARPVLDGDIDFNISHSGNYVTCVIAKNVRVGIDVEHRTKIDFNEFDGVMNKKQWHFIKESDKPLEMFYNYWTIKESVIKADGRGMNIDLDKIEILKDKATLNGKIWHIKSIDLFQDTSLCVAFNRSESIKLKEVKFY